MPLTIARALATLQLSPLRQSGIDNEVQAQDRAGGALEGLNTVEVRGE